MDFKKLIGIIVVLSIPYVIYGQEEEELEELLMEQIHEDLGDEVDLSEVTERLSYYKRYPIDLNRTGEAELGNLIFLTPQQIESILLHRQLSGAFISIRELQGIPGMDMATIQRLIPYVTIGYTSGMQDFSVGRMMRDSDQMLMIRYGRILEKQQGYHIADAQRSRYLGDPNRYAVRYRLQYEDKIAVAINMEKDAGEPFFREKQRLGFDFYSGHIAFNNVSKHVKQLVIGDYSLQFGQGLIAWNGLSFGKGAWMGSVSRQGGGLRPYTSMNENNFQRGVAVRMVAGNWELTPFVAFNKLSGNVMEQAGNRYIISVNSSGLHRTPTEQEYRQAIGQWVYGANMSYRWRRIRVGATYMSTNFDGSVQRGNALRQQFDFDGSALRQLGVHYNYTHRNYYFFGETAYAIGGGIASNNGMIASLHPKMSLFANHRSYWRDYHQFYAQSLGEGSTVSNEKGVYAGLSYHPNRKVEWLNFIDIFRFPWLRFRADAPSSGADFLSQLTYSWYKKGHILLRYRHRLRQENTMLDDRYSNLLADVVRNQLRLDYQYKFSERWRLRSRVEISHYNKEYTEQSGGILCFQDLFWKSTNGKLQLNTRLAFFETEGYNARIYAYENDVLYASGFPMYYDKGIRTYLNVRWRLGRNVDIWARYALTRYSDREEVGTGLDLIEGRQRSDFKTQVRWRW